MSDKTTVSLGTALDIMHAASLKERLSAALAKKDHILLISDKVQRADTAGLQLVLAFKQHAEKSNKRVSWQKPSEALINASELLGLKTQLALD